MKMTLQRYEKDNLNGWYCGKASTVFSGPGAKQKAIKEGRVLESKNDNYLQQAEHNLLRRSILDNPTKIVAVYINSNDNKLIDTELQKLRVQSRKMDRSADGVIIYATDNKNINNVRIININSIVSVLI